MLTTNHQTIKYEVIHHQESSSVMTSRMARSVIHFIALKKGPDVLLSDSLEQHVYAVVIWI